MSDPKASLREGGFTLGMLRYSCILGGSQRLGQS